MICMVTFSIIIPTYRRASRLEACLRSLFAADLSLVLEVLLVVHEDDAPGQRAALRWAESRRRIRIVYTKTASRSAARNAAVAVAQGDWCYFLDDDVVVPPDVIRTLRAAILAHPEAAVVGGPNRLPPGSGLFERCVDRVLGSRLGAGAMRRRYVGLGKDGWTDERSLISCNLAVEIKALRSCLGFNERLDYGEETLLLARLRESGRRLLYIPRLWVYHHRRSDWAGFCLQAFRSGAGRGSQTVMMPSSLSAEFLGPPVLAVLCAAAWQETWARALLAAYAGLCLLQAAAAGWRERSVAAAFWTALLIPSGHLAYGLGFWLFPLAGPRRAILRGRRERWRRRLGGWVLRWSGAPVLGALFRGYYRLALRAVRVWVRLAAIPVEELWLRRSLTGTDWSPGSSDVDLAVELPEMDGEREHRWMDRWNKGYRRLRRVFPILGEVQFGTRLEWSRYLRDGDVRSVELPKEAVSLFIKGRSDPRESVHQTGVFRPDGHLVGDWPSVKYSVDVWTEQLHAYVRLTRLYFEEGEDPHRASAHARKLLLDVGRYGRLLEDHGAKSAMPRAEMAASMRQQQAMAAALQALEAAGAGEGLRRAVESACLATAENLEASAGRVLGSVPANPGPVVPPSLEVRRFSREREDFERVCRMLRSATGGNVERAIHDNVYHFLIGVRRGPAETMRGVWSTIRNLRGTVPALAGTVLPLPPAAFRLALWSPYLEDPLRFLSVSAVLGGDPSGAAISGTSAGLRRHVLSVWNVDRTSLGAPPRPLTELLLRESVAHLAVNWRAFGGLERRESDLYRWVYLYSRVMSLRLHQRMGEAWPVFPLAPLASRFGEAFPEEKSWVEAQVLGAEGLGDWRRHRGFFSRNIREILACPNSN